MSDSTRLALATSEELTDELFRRYPDAVFVGMKESPADPDCGQVYQRFQGHLVMVQGLCTRVIRKIQDTEDYPNETEHDL